MIVSIKCTTCEEIMGTLDKSEVTDRDRIEWQEMMTCPNGHQTVSLDEMSGEERTNYQDFLAADRNQKVAKDNSDPITSYKDFLEAKAEAAAEAAEAVVNP